MVLLSSLSRQVVRLLLLVLVVVAIADVEADVEVEVEMEVEVKMESLCWLVAVNGNGRKKITKEKESNLGKI